MARKAGPGDGAEDAPGGHAGLSPEEPGLRPAAGRAEDSELESRTGSPEGESRSENLSEDVPGAVTPAASPESDEAPSPEESETSALSGTPDQAEEQLVPPVVEPVGVPDADVAASLPPDGAPEPWRIDSVAGRPEPSSDRAEAPGVTDGSVASSSSGSGGAFGSHPPAAAVPPPRRGGVGALLMGGVVAAALGFGAAWLAQDRLGPGPDRLPPDLEERLASVEARALPDDGAAQGLADRVAELEARLTELEEAPGVEADLQPLRDEIAQGFAAAEARAAEIEGRVAALEDRPADQTAAEASQAPDAGPALRPASPLDPDAVRDEVAAALEPRLAEVEAGLDELRAALEPRLAETEAGLEDLRAGLADAQAALDDLAARLDRAEAQSAAAADEARTAAETLADAETRAAAAEAQARARAALGEAEAALAAGESFEAPLEELQATGVDVPEDLAGMAPEGAPTLAALREAFPEAARAGLSAAREEGLLDDGGGVLSFLRGQLSVRSVAPREGEDPDAVLSRAEAQLAAGQLDAALAEIATLPEPVRAPLADWIAQAEARARADATLAGLREALPDLDASPAD